jgi:hypothetical protein
VSIKSEVHTLEWPHEADFDPETRHDWPEHVEALKEESAKWELIEG